MSADALRDAATRVPDAIALIEASTGRSVRYAELDAVVDRVARGLGSLGLIAGQRVLLVGGNRIDLVVALRAAARARLVAVPLDPRATPDELAQTLAATGARLVVAAPEAAAAVEVALGLAMERRPPDHRRSVLLVRLPDAGDPRATEVARAGGDAATDISWADLAAGAEVALPGVTDAEALAVLVSTSGSTGRPRLAMLTHRALSANADQVAALQPPVVDQEDLVLGMVPLSHVYGLAVLSQVLRSGAGLLLLDGPRAEDPEAVLRAVAEHRARVVPVSPAILTRWARLDGLADSLVSVRLLLSGSAPLSPDTAALVQERGGHVVHQGYGLTEAGPVLTSTLASQSPRAGTVGAPLPGVGLRVADVHGAPPSGADPGEILVSGEQMFSGYWPDGDGAPGPGEWLGTGDLGYLDDAGNLVLVERRAEVVVVSGFTVYPSEVEDLLADVDGVREVAVVGVSDPGASEALVAYLRPVPGADPATVRSAAQRACEQRLARFKRPSRIEVVDTLPHTRTGKVAKGRLRASDADGGELR